MQKIIHSLDVMLGMTIVMGQVFMAMDFWRGKKRALSQKLLVLLMAHGIGFWLVIVVRWQTLRLGTALVLLAAMSIDRMRGRKNPKSFLLRMSGMGVILAAEIICGTGKNLLPCDPVLHFVLQMVGVVLLGGGVTIAILARKYMGRQLAIAGNQSRTETVVDTGPFGLVRHPLYTGAFLVTAGLGLVMRSVIVLAGGILLVAFPLHLTAVKEENELLNAQVGYEQYFQKVRDRYLPLTPIVTAIVKWWRRLFPQPVPQKGGKV